MFRKHLIFGNYYDMIKSHSENRNEDVYYEQV